MAVTDQQATGKLLNLVRNGDFSTPAAKPIDGAKHGSVYRAAPVRAASGCTIELIPSRIGRNELSGGESPQGANIPSL